MIPKFRAWFPQTKEMEVCESYKETSKLFMALDADDGFLEVMQSTGLKDKNGKEIFEGDILELSDCDEVIGNTKIIWDNSMVTYMVEAVGVDGREAFYKVLSDEDFSYEVIGNIYENPELLEVD